MRRPKKFFSSSGMIMRLIDIVLLLLFGFISISQINRKSLIALPKSAAVPLAVPDREEVVFVGVMPDGTFLVENETRSIVDPRVLQVYLRQTQAKLAAQKTRMRVRIRANWDVPMTHVFRAVSSCETLKLPTGLDVIRASNSQ
jgi:biopolymer transport protein ExbD